MRIDQLNNCYHITDECFSCKHWDECERPEKQQGNPLFVILISLVIWTGIVYLVMEAL